MPPHPSSYDAVLFDLDGVLTATAGLHAAAGKQTLDPVLAAHAQPPFDLGRDYVAHVDGKPREAGVRDLLRARGIAAGDDTVRRIAATKQRAFEAALAGGGIEAFAGSVRWVRRLRAEGVHTAVVSSSANARAVLRAAGIDALFDLTIDGADVARLGLRGKPAPDGFLEAAGRLGVPPCAAVVVEDAVAGVSAGRAGGFGLVLGVARGATPDQLLAAGADLVVGDLGELVA